MIGNWSKTWSKDISNSIDVLWSKQNVKNVLAALPSNYQVCWWSWLYLKFWTVLFIIIVLVILEPSPIWEGPWSPLVANGNCLSRRACLTWLWFCLCGLHKLHTFCWVSQVVFNSPTLALPVNIWVVGYLCWTVFPVVHFLCHMLFVSCFPRVSSVRQTHGRSRSKLSSASIILCNLEGE